MTVSRSEAARRAGVTPQTLRRWAQEGLVPQAGSGEWTPAAVAQARIVARLRERGHSLGEIRDATQAGRLAFGFADDLLADDRPTHTLAEAAAETGLEPALIERVFLSAGFSVARLDRLSDGDLALLRYVAAVLAAGFPLVALLQLVRVYGQALAQIADAEVRLFHLYVHEPLMRSGVPSAEIGDEMEGLARELLPLSAPIMERVHQRFLAHFVEQDVIGHMEADLDDGDRHPGRLRVAIAFADLAGYTRLTEEEGEEHAVDAVERFIEDVEVTLPDDARVIKTIGYRDGDYFGREVNQASRVAARAAGGEVIVTRPVVDAAGPHLRFARIGEVRLKGFDEPTELFVARQADGDG